MSVAQLEAAADALGDLRERTVFLGGATIVLWLTDPAARRPRVTYDIDVVAEVATLAEYEAFQAALRERGFAEDVHSGVIGRWRHETCGILLDAVPRIGRLAGFSDQWLAPATASAISRTLPSGTEVRAVCPPWMLVMKLQAFTDRGCDDCLANRDFEDVVLLVDAREEILDEIGTLPVGAAAFVCEQLDRVMTLPTFEYGLEGAVGGVDSRARVTAVTLPRLQWLAARR